MNDSVNRSPAGRYAELGYRVFPCQPGSKAPLAGSHGCKDATTDTEQVEAWWTERPNGNIAIATDGLVVVDVDLYKGTKWLTPERAADLAQYRSETPRGGVHFWFKRQPLA